jgi:hypothetical protein
MRRSVREFTTLEINKDFQGIPKWKQYQDLLEFRSSVRQIVFE